MLIIIIYMKLTAPKTLQKFVFKTVEIPNELLPQSDVGRFSRDIFKVASNQKIRYHRCFGIENLRSFRDVTVFELQKNRFSVRLFNPVEVPQCNSVRVWQGT